MISMYVVMGVIERMIVCFQSYVWKKICVYVVSSDEWSHHHNQMVLSSLLITMDIQYF